MGKTLRQRQARDRKRDVDGNFIEEWSASTRASSEGAGDSSAHEEENRSPDALSPLEPHGAPTHLRAILQR